MLERRCRSHAIFTLVGVLICLSVWQMIGGPGPPGSVYDLHVFEKNVPAYSILLENNASTGAYFMEQLPSWDYSTLINLEDFDFDLINMVCNDSSPLLLTLVHSAPKNTAKRKTIRETWGQARPSLKVLFLLGGVTEPDLQARIEEENLIYRDLVQGNYVDAYRNMTYKHVMALKYATYHCPQAKYVLKTDDDVFVNMPTMLDFLSYEFSPLGSRKLLMCTAYQKSQVKRTFRSKWRVSFKEYPYSTYPTYCPGWAVVYSPDVVFNLYKEAQRSDFFWIDDVHITGTLAIRANITHTPVLDMLMLDWSQVSEIVEKGKNESIPPVFLYGPPNLRQDDILGLWDYVKDRTTYYHHTARP